MPDITSELHAKAKHIRDWIKEHDAEEWASPQMMQTSLEEARLWDRAADEIARLRHELALSNV